ncbi:MAG TPA: hypothetical protein VHF65_03745 [Nitrososphaera sp.]|nr:hypothetical protein [Nitrososphaera sp.]
MDSSEFLSKFHRACYDITHKIGFLGIKESNRKKMQVEERVASSSTMMDPWSSFLYTMKARRGREKITEEG